MTDDPVALEVEPDALRSAEFAQTDDILHTMIGRTVTATAVEDTRIVITTSDGTRYFFYGFMGEDTPR
jgi:hypothetical protein